MGLYPLYSQRWVRNFKNVSLQKQNAICKLRAQLAKRNCALELFKAHCVATINAKNASFHKKILKRNSNFIIKIRLSRAILNFASFELGSSDYEALDLTTTLLEPI
jgi:hypothetical protein